MKLYYNCLLTVSLLLISVPGISAEDTPTRPSSVDNSDTPWFPRVFDQLGESCASAAAVGYIFSYEINAARGTPADEVEHIYPYLATHNFLNDGDESVGTPYMYADAWRIIKENGIMNHTEFGTPDFRLTKWTDGYELYYSGMKNRVATIDSVSFDSPEALSVFRQWLYDHGNGSETGGLFLIIVCAAGIQDGYIQQGPEKGKYIVSSLGTTPEYGQHALTIVGYNDDILVDINGDGHITDTVDINNDGKITLQDREHGAFKCVNTWGPSSWDSGFVYIPYRLFFSPFSSGGLLTRYGYFITVHKEYNPVRTIRTMITHETRNALALSVGIAADSTAEKPEKIRALTQFSYAGGPLPMAGYKRQDSIEIGLDVSDLADSIGHAESAAYFLVVHAKEAGGSCSRLSLIDYSGGDTLTFDAPDVPIEFPEGTTTLRIPASAVAVVAPRVRRSFLNPSIQLMHHNGGITCILPDNHKYTSLFMANGKCIAKRTAAHGSMITFTNLTRGIYLLDCTDRNGHNSTLRFVVP